MDRKTALDRLRSFEPELRAAGVTHLFLYGSTARSEARPMSDIDLAFDVDRRRKFSLLDQAKLQVMLSDHLGVPVDFLERSALRPFARRTAERDMIAIF